MITAVAILGPTAAGKSRLGMALAVDRGGEILSIDSRQAYRRIDIGTAKPTIEERRAVPHHLIDILDLNEKSSAEAFARSALAAIRGAAGRGRIPVLVGGSGLYFRAISRGFFDISLDRGAREAFAQSVRSDSAETLHARLARVDPASAERIHANDRYRIVRALEVNELTGTPLSEHLRRQSPDPSRAGIRFVKIGLTLARPALHRRIADRTRAMFVRGWIDEVRGLLDSGVDPAWPGMRTLGYPDVVELARGARGIDETEARVIELTRQYAKRQITWFSREEDVAWLEADDPNLPRKALALVDAAGTGEGASR